MKGLKLFSVMVMSLAIGLGTAYAATYEIDDVHSSVGFQIQHLVSKVKGNFNSFSGTIEFDPNAMADSSVKASIEASSINTNNEMRDDHLRGTDFFDTAKFPSLTFESKKVENGKILGDLTLHGVTKEVALDFTYLGTVKAPDGQEKVGFSATTEINRKDFGINYNKALDQGGFILGETVKIEIEIEATLKQ